MEVIDQATEREERHREAALARWRAQQNHAAISALECEDCGDPIPQARREAIIGCATCIECQMERERHAQT